jgi:hypothetical protein
VDSESINKAREAMRQRMQEVAAQNPPEQVPVSPKEPLPQPHAVKPSKSNDGFPPLSSPALSISADKDARLKELLSRYQADQVTPEEYHAARAKILAEP